jgi:hypothetical protein
MFGIAVRREEMALIVSLDAGHDSSYIPQGLIRVAVTPASQMLAKSL